MSRSLGTLTLDLVAKIGGFTDGLSKADREAQKRSRAIKKSMDSAKTAILGFGAVSSGAITAYTLALSDSAKETQIFARLAGASNQEFQKIAISAEAFNISQEKTADILKDVNDKIGDFIQTGGGPLKDFFDNIAPQVGVTADQFAKLSGPQALQLYVDSLEKANVSQKDMTFFMEAIASDSTNLLPLLRDNGKELKRLGDEAERAGNVLSDMDFEQLKQVDDSIRDLKLAFSGMANEVVISAIPAVNDLLDVLSDETTIESAKAIGNAVVTAMTAATKAIRDTIGTVKFLSEEVASALNGIASDDIVRLERDAEKIKGILSGGFLGQVERVRFFGPDGVVEFLDDTELQAKLDDINAAIDRFRNDAESKASIKINIEAANDASINASPKSKPVESKAITESQRKAAEEAKKQAAEVVKLYNSQADALSRQINLNNDAGEAARIRYDIESGELAKLSDQQQKQLIGLGEQVDAINEVTEAKRKAAEIQDEINSQAVQIQESLRSEEQMILDSYQNRRDIILSNTEITGEAQKNLLLDIENAKNEELDAINSGFWESYLLSAEENLNALDELSANMISSVSSKFGDALESIVFESESLGDALGGIAESMARSTINALGQMAAEWLAYKAVQMAVGKTAQASSSAALTGNALAAQQMAALNAFSSTAAIPIVGPPAAPGAAAAAIAATTPFVSAIAASSAIGMAHEGMDAIPETGTWLLEKGERVTTEKTSKRLDRTLDSINSGRSSGSTINLIVENNNGSRVTEKKDDQGNTVGIMIDDVRSGGSFTGALESTYPMLRRGGS